MLFSRKHIQIMASNALKRSNRRNIGSAPGDAIAGDQRKDPMVVTFARKFSTALSSSLSEPFSARDGGVQGPFGRKVPKTRVASPRRWPWRDFFVVVPLKPFGGKTVRGGGNQAGLAIVAGVAGSWRSSVHVIVVR